MSNYHSSEKKYFNKRFIIPTLDKRKQSRFTLILVLVLVSSILVRLAILAVFYLTCPAVLTVSCALFPFTRTPARASVRADQAMKSLFLLLFLCYWTNVFTRIDTVKTLFLPVNGFVRIDTRDMSPQPGQREWVPLSYLNS